MREMKRLLLLVTILLFFVTPFRAYAADASSDTTVEKADYTLPYPGLLPDNPLYGVKMFRDNMVGLLISDPLKKAEFDILQADKRLQSGVYLIQKDKKKSALGMTTILKGQNYFDQAIGKLYDARKQGLATTAVTTKITNAAKKHAEVLHDLEKHVAKEQLKDVTLAEKHITEFQNRIAKFLQEK